MPKPQCVKVIFTAKIKREIPADLLNKVRREAENFDGFIGLESTMDGDIWYKVQVVDNCEWPKNFTPH